MTAAPAARPAAVIGGGIGGLAAALALRAQGLAVEVFEQAQAFAEVGAGIQISPNGARVLEALGLGTAAAAKGLPLEAVEPMDGLSGRRVARFDLRDQPGPPYRVFHRADLIDLLAAAARDNGIDLHLGARIAAVAPTGAFEAGGRRIAPGLTIGADGVRSIVRPVLNGAGDPAFTGQVAWRAVVEGEAPPVARIWMAPGRHVVTYPLPGGRVNIVAVQERREWSAEGWHREADPGDLRHVFRGMTGRVTSLLARVDRCLVWGLFRHPVAGVWHRAAGEGALALAGDAAHPTLPFLAQGANLALEDAWVLARHAAEGTLDAYGAARRARVSRAIAAANANARNYHLGGPARTAALLALGLTGRLAPGAFMGRLRWLYGHDVTA
jgi:salicylate hydroxylase